MNDNFGMDVARGRAGDVEEEHKLILPLAVSTSSFDGQSFQAESIFFRQASPALASLLPRHFQPPPFQCLPLPLGPPHSMLNGQIGPGEEQQFQQEGGQQPVFPLQPLFGSDPTCPPEFAAALQPNGPTTNGPELATLGVPIPPAICRGCGLLIQESHLLSLNRRRQKSEPENGEGIEEASKGGADEEVEEADFWHEHCLRCAKCGRQLGEAAGTCFLHNGRPFCREDHEKLFGGSGTLAQCSRCALPIGPSEFVFRSAGLHVHHVQCFLCSCCGQALAKGDQYLCSPEGQLICQRDFGLWQLQRQLAVGSKLPPFPPANGTIEQSPHFLPLPPFADLDFSLQRPTFHHHHHHGDRSKKVPKRPRTILNAPQRKAFKLAFERGAKPSRKVREQLARDTGLSVRVVQVWFQNQRAKMKKERKREMDKQQQQMGGLLPMSTGEGGGTDSEECTGQLKSPNSGGSSGRNRSGMVVEDDSDEEGDEDEADDEEEEEQDSATSCNSSGLLMLPTAGNGGTGMDGMEGGEDGLNGGPNPIERLYSMHQNYFAFV